MSRTYRTALVGCGKIGSLFADDPLMRGDIFAHAEAYHACARTDLVALVDTNREALDRCGARWHVEARYSTVREMMDAATPDIVSVATPTGTHHQVMVDLLSGDARPRAILCEKPLAASLEDAEHVVALAKEKGVVLVTMHMRRYANNMRNLRKFLRDGGIGDIRGVSGWLTKGTIHNGTHWFDLLRYLVGEAEMVSGLDSLHEGGDDPTLDVAMFMRSGILATMRAAGHGHFTICEMDIVGTKGRAQIVDSSYRVDISMAVPSPRYSGYVELVPSSLDMGDRKDVMLHAVEDVVHCLDTGAAPQSTGEDGVEALRIALAAHRSARNHGQVELVRPGSASQ